MSDVEAAVGEVARELAVLRGTSRWLQIPQATGTLLLAHFDGEPARTAEAEARAREEMREACARAGVAAVRHSQQTTDQCRLEVGSAINAACVAEEHQAAVDLLDEFGPFGLVEGVRAMAKRLHETRARAEKAEAERDELRRRMEVVLHAGPSTALAASVFDRARRAEVERDEALRAVTQVTAERDFAQSVAKQNHERLMKAVRALRFVRACRSSCTCHELAAEVLAKYPEGS
jgi:hypothetical protein